ncbi:MAG TPA: C45 family peptidase [Bryobacteraceae bacterium]|nr:C45 family peptidase [Bryobacteraceae bacterium]
MTFRPALVSLVVCLLSLTTLLPASPDNPDAVLRKASRKLNQNGWIQVHLEGSPSEIGYQHGSLLSKEIAELQKVIELELERDTKKDWAFFRRASEEVLWPKVDAEYREELQGIVNGLLARGVKLDIWDVVAMNAYLELGPYYVPFWESKQPDGEQAKHIPLPERCSAFIATGDYTTDGKIVMGHNTWSGYLDGQRWNIVFDIVPERGSRILMDGLPGLVHSASDFGINSAGLMITETTISQFSGFDPEGIPEFVRARKAMQYATSINEFAHIMSDGNNGGYANNWLIGDNKTGEIASLELGLKNVTLRRTMDGYFVGANFPVSQKLAEEETSFPMKDRSISANARRARWEQLMAEWKKKIDVKAGQLFLADATDSFTGKLDPNERTLCGRIDLSPRGVGGWVPPFGLAGAAQNKVVDSALAGQMSFTGAIGPLCGPPFRASRHLTKHPDFKWARPYLKDMSARPWTLLQADPRAVKPQP